MFVSWGNDRVTDFPSLPLYSSLHHCVQFLICNLKILTDPVEYETPLNSLSLNGCPYREGGTLFRQWEFAVVFSCCRERRYSTPTECDHFANPFTNPLYSIFYLINLMELGQGQQKLRNAPKTRLEHSTGEQVLW